MAKCLFSTCSFNVVNFSAQTWSRFKAKLKLKLKQSEVYTKHSPSKQDVYCGAWASSIITPAASKLAVYIEDRHLSTLMHQGADIKRHLIWNASVILQSSSIWRHGKKAWTIKKTQVSKKENKSSNHWLNLPPAFMFNWQSERLSIHPSFHPSFHPLFRVVVGLESIPAVTGQKAGCTQRQTIIHAHI